MIDRAGQVWKHTDEDLIFLIVGKSNSPAVNWWAIVNIATGRFEDTGLHEGMLESDAYGGYGERWRRIA